jgi:hypothetical protein
MINEDVESNMTLKDIKKMFKRMEREKVES